MFQKLRRLQKKMLAMEEDGWVAPKSAQTTSVKDETTVAVAELIQMRGDFNRLTAEHKLWVDKKTHSNPGSHVGDFKAQTDADGMLFKEKPKAALAYTFTPTSPYKVCVSVCLSVYLSLRPSVCLSVCQCTFASRRRQGSKEL